MSAINTLAVCSNSSAANYKQWAQAISNALASLGWVQSSDTGQVVWSSVSTAPTQNTFQDFEVWKAADAHASTCPIFMRIDYGSDNSSTPAPQIKITVGTGSNGTGTINGNSLSAMTLINSSAAALSPTTQYNCYFSGDSGGRFSMMMWRDNVTFNMFFGIERSIDSTGAYTDAYFTVLASGVSFVNQSHVFKPGTGTTFQVSTTGAGCSFVHCILTTTIVSNNACVLPLIPLVGRADNPCTMVGLVQTGDQSEGATFTCNLYGSSRTYLYSKAANLVSIMATAAGTAMRYD